jgi:dethiobiotin synthetase/adenosylmethionine--8-amino-7-oxononanoate aminotransferase
MATAAAPLMQRRVFSSSSTILKSSKMHLMFGSNTDVGKTICSAGLVRASSIKGDQTTHYIKPLQCGGSDQAFVEKYCSRTNMQAQTLFNFDTPASPHLASMLENKPTSDVQVMEALNGVLHAIEKLQDVTQHVWLETAGGVLSPTTASPDNKLPLHAQSPVAEHTQWGWTTQADLYRSMHVPAILVGDGRLGGISATLSSLESLLSRGYHVAGILLLEEAGSNNSAAHPNVTALREYTARQPPLFDNPAASVISLPAIPSDPNVPLYDWYKSAQVSDTFDAFYENLSS